MLSIISQIDMSMSKNCISAPTPGKLRPSNLPKFAACRCYDSSDSTSSAAVRGTLVDEVMRKALFSGENVPPTVEGLDAEALAAAAWGVERVREIAAGAPIITREEDLRVDLHREVLPDFEDGTFGTLDALVPQQCAVIDFKTGLVRNYKEQMAAYCLAMMTRSEEDITMDPTDRYTAYLVFVDAQEVVQHVFSKEEAVAVLRAAIDKPQVPTACDYCSWCRHFSHCPVTMQAVAEVQHVGRMLPAATPAALSADVLPPALEELVDDEAAAREFLSMLATVKSWAELLKIKLKEKLVKLEESGQKSPYFVLTKAAEKRSIYPLALGRYMKEFGFDRIFKLVKPIAYKDFEPVWQQVFRNKPIPEELIKVEAGARSFKTRPNKK